MLDEVALLVGVKETGEQAQIAGLGRDPGLQLGRRHVSIVLGGPASTLVEVHAVHHLDPVAGAEGHRVAGVRGVIARSTLAPRPAVRQSALGSRGAATPERRAARTAPIGGRGVSCPWTWLGRRPQAPPRRALSADPWRPTAHAPRVAARPDRRG